MRTQIIREFKAGFFLTEQELRRISRTCEEHIAKVSEPVIMQFSEVLADGSVLESGSVDDVAGLENEGAKSISTLTIKASDSAGEEPKTRIKVTFGVSQDDMDKWKSISLRIEGESRDWAFLAASDLEERVKRVKRLSIGYFAEGKFIYVASMLVSLLVSMWAVNLLVYPSLPIDQLESAYTAGRIANATEAIIFYEKAKAAQQNSTWFFMPILFSIPLALIFFITYVVRKLSRSYHFYWGDYINLYDRRARLLQVFWVVIVLGFIVSILAGLAVEFF